MVAPNPSSREKNIERIMQLIDRGYIDQILISGGPTAFGDAFPRTYRSAQTYAPYSRLTVDIIPALKDTGLAAAQIEQLSVTNPRRVLETLCMGGY